MDNHSFVRDKSFSVRVFSQKSYNALVSWVIFTSLPASPARAFNSCKDTTTEPFVVFQPRIPVPNASPTSFFTVERSFSSFNLESSPVIGYLHQPTMATSAIPSLSHQPGPTVVVPPALTPKSSLANESKRSSDLSKLDPESSPYGSLTLPFVPRLQ